MRWMWCSRRSGVSSIVEKENALRSYTTSASLRSAPSPQGEGFLGAACNAIAKKPDFPNQTSTAQPLLKWLPKAATDAKHHSRIKKTAGRACSNQRFFCCGVFQERSLRHRLNWRKQSRLRRQPASPGSFLCTAFFFKRKRVPPYPSQKKAPTIQGTDKTFPFLVDFFVQKLYTVYSPY